MFREVRKVKSLDLRALGLEMKERRTALMADMGLDLAEEGETA